MEKDEILESALNYHKTGFSVIPFAGKQPIAKWEKYQTERADEDQIKRWFDRENPPNVGFVTGTISNLAVIDIDTEEGKEIINNYIPDSMLIPVVSTPRGGQHLYFQCTDSSLRGCSGRPPGCDLRANGNCVVAPPSISSNGIRYKWIVNSYTTRPPLPEKYLSYICSSNSIYCNSIDKKTISSEQMFVEGRRDEDLFHIAYCLIKGGAKESEILQVLEILAKNCSPPFPERELKIKIQSALKHSERREKALAQEIEDWIRLQSGYITSTDIYNCLQLSTRAEKKNVSIILKRLVNKGIIERCGNRAGHFRIVDTESQIIDWRNTQVDSIDIKYPFGIEQYVLTMPKNIIVCAGSPNAGKTAFLLNVIAMNMHKHKTNYFSSEMGAIELRNRLEKFDFPLSKWNFVAKERSSNFVDVIVPDEVNIIDFMELTEDFWKIGGMLKEIHDKLTTGIAIIALQKNPGAAIARGGVGSLEKPRLYLTMEAGSIRIEKGKNWAQENVNPNGLTCDFKLVRGCKFIQTTEWYRKETTR